MGLALCDKSNLGGGCVEGGFGVRIVVFGAGVDGGFDVRIVVFGGGVDGCFGVRIVVLGSSARLGIASMP